jgi:hypothetical protein
MFYGDKYLRQSVEKCYRKIKKGRREGRKKLKGWCIILNLVTTTNTRYLQFTVK